MNEMWFVVTYRYTDPDGKCVFVARPKSYAVFTGNIAADVRANPDIVDITPAPSKAAAESDAAEQNANFRKSSMLATEYRLYRRERNHNA